MVPWTVPARRCLVMMTFMLLQVLRHEFFNYVEGSSFVPKPHLPRMINRSVKVVLSKVNKGSWSPGKSRRCKVQ